MTQLTPAALAPYIDHTLLKPDARREQIATLCAEARQHHFATVCVNSSWVPFAAGELAGSGVGVCSVIGFPLGAAATETKAAEAAWAVAHGAAEIDMVLPIGLLKAGEDALVKEDIAAVHTACGAAALKVILETGLLSDDEKKRACAICTEVGVAFVKTSTGFGHGGATVADVALMRAAAGESIAVKAAGGVRSFADALAMIEAGATRLGTSSGVALVSGGETAGY